MIAERLNAAQQRVFERTELRRQVALHSALVLGYHRRRAGARPWPLVQASREPPVAGAGQGLNIGHTFPIFPHADP